MSGIFMSGIFEDSDRDFLAEAQMMMKGMCGITIELRHLEAMKEHHDCSLIRIANKLDEMRKTVLDMP